MKKFISFIFLVFVVAGCSNNPQSSNTESNYGDQVVAQYNAGTEILVPLNELGFILKDDPINKYIDIYKDGQLLYRVIYIPDGMNYIKPNILGGVFHNVIIVATQDRVGDDYSGGPRYGWFIYKNNVFNPLQKTSVFTYNFMYETEVIHVKAVRMIDNSLIFKGSGYYEEIYSVYQGNGLFKNYWRSWNEVKNIWEWHQ